jgi:hypothetical protein
MKKLYSLFIAVIFLTGAFRANAQNNNNGGGFDQLIKSSPGDATKLVQSFAEPLFKGFGVGLNSGWNNTALTKKFLHFDLRITANGAMVPTTEKTFDVTKIGLSSHITPDASSPTNIAQTIGGDKNAANPVLRINDDNGAKVSSFTMPKAILPLIPAPNIQLTIGLFKNTDVTIRTTPTINLGTDAGSVSEIGFGIKHDIIQDFAGKGKIKPFDLALAVNYNKLTYTKTLNIQPDAGSTPAPGQQAADFSTQRINSTFSGVNVQAIISKKLLFFTPFASVSYQTASTDFGVLGNYPLTSTAPGQSGRYIVVTDPIHINETSISGMRTDFGFQMNLLILRIYAAYSVSAGGYNSVNGGIGLGF